MSPIKKESLRWETRELPKQPRKVLKSKKKEKPKLGGNNTSNDDSDGSYEEDEEEEKKTGETDQNDKKIKIFDCRSHRLLQHYDAHDGPVNSVAFN